MGKPRSKNYGLSFTCTVYGKLFKPSKARSGTPFYCNRQCGGIGRFKGSYTAFHMFLSRHNKKKGVCDFCGVTGKRTENALKQGREYSRDINDYHELCMSCHKKYDLAHPTLKTKPDRLSDKPIPKKWVPVIATKEGVEQRFNSVTEAAETLGILRSAISACVHGRHKTCRGYSFKKAI